ncbi:MAG: sulfatase-like hydrolase/transferase [Tannerellaceae bacterium]|nr:sulfatase-like hydrolase/transferase [Tannerellaceae bacterium]
MDSLIGEVFSALEEKGMLENSVIIITGDHGQEFNENKEIIGDMGEILQNGRYRYHSFYAIRVWKKRVRSSLT